MSAVWIVARRDLRRRWATLLLIGVMGGMAVGAAVAGATVARRTATAYERLEGAARLGDALTIVNAGAPGVDAVRALDGIEASRATGLWIGAVRDDAVNYVGITGADWSSPLYRPVVVDGRLPDPDAPGEVLVNEQLSFGDLGVGDTLDLSLLSPFQYGEFPQTEPPDGPDVTVEIVGTYRLPGLPGIVPPFVAGPGWIDAYSEWKSTDLVVLDLVDQSALGELVLDLQEVERSVPRIRNRSEFPVVEPVLLAPQRDSVAAATGILVAGLLAFTVVTLVAGAVAVTQALVRMHGLGAEDQAAEAALGMTPLQRLVARGIGLVPPVVIAAVLAVAGGIVGGWFEPVGGTRNYEPVPGARPNLVVVSAGLVIVVLGIGGIGLLTAWRAGRVRRRPASQPASAVVGRLARIGAGPVGVTGVRLALEPGRGRTAVPTRTALVSAVVGVTGVVAVAVFGAGLHHLVGDPGSWGGNADLRISAGVSQAELDRADVDGIEGSARAEVASVLAGDRILPAESVQPMSSPLAWTIREGRVPERPGEMVLGTRAARWLDLDVGDTVVVTDRVGDEHRLAVVGTGLGAPLLSGQLGGTALLWPDDLEAFALAEPIGQTYVDVAPGIDIEVASRELGEVVEVSPRELPPEVASLDRLGRLPAILGGFLALIALLAIGNALVLATRRRRRDLAVLRSMGFRPREAGSSILVMAGTIAACGVVVGVPVGAALGSVLWRGLAYSAAVPADTTIPFPVLAAVAAGFVVVVLLLAVLPARRAASLRPAAALRSE